MKYLYFLILLLYCQLAWTQNVDNTALYRTINSDKYVRIHYENDYFSATDEYYTQGINLELVHPVIRRLPTSYLLIHPKSKPVKYGISLESLGYTPTSISNDNILYGDRPFAGVLFIKTFSIVSDSVKKYRIVSALSLGTIGPAAGTEEMQKSIHSWIGGESPHGWQNQIQADLVLNYEVSFEKQLLAVSNVFCMSGKLGGRAGTLSDKAYSSVALMAGYFDNPFTTISGQKHRFQIYIYDEPQFNLVGYDASLQGGVFNRSSPYTIPAGDITRGVFQNNFGVVFKIKRFYAEYFQCFLSKEFETGGTHRWGGIRLGLAF